MDQLKNRINRSKNLFIFEKENSTFRFENRLPSKLDPKEITFVIDEFQMNINTLNSQDAGFFPIYDTGVEGGDSGGFDVGSAGGNGGVGGGE